MVRVVPADDPQARIETDADELVVISKADLAPVDPPAGAIVTSAVTGAGIAALITAIVDRLVPEDRRDPALLSGAVPFTEAQVAAIKALLR